MLKIQGNIVGVCILVLNRFLKHWSTVPDLEAPLIKLRLPYRMLSDGNICLTVRIYAWNVRTNKNNRNNASGHTTHTKLCRRCCKLLSLEMKSGDLFSPVNQNVLGNRMKCQAIHMLCFESSRDCSSVHVISNKSRNCESLSSKYLIPTLLPNRTLSSGYTCLITVLYFLILTNKSENF